MESLQNQFLLAMPGLSDPYFKRSVVYVCEHNDEGAMGLVINIPVDLSVEGLLEQIELPEHQEAEEDERDSLDKPVYQGGPMARERGFVLHSPKPGFNSSMQLSSELMITTSKDVLETLGTGSEPNDYLVTLGYAGWGAGQLEQEIADNSWLTLPATTDIIFDVPSHQRWEAAAKHLGIDIWQLSSDAGHA
ncbi:MULTISPECIES: YqgE/AlgH family protein [Aliagarivorans]|uniref:YqgE/AlgH family protein n=1 Tax=Aliagarivorans TaxID=882379 RepID=UPI000427E38A|nr:MULTISPECIES: YqgE/AlgH family protein [Aliagarivorans]